MESQLPKSKWYEDWFSAGTRIGVLSVLVLCLAIGSIVGALVGFIGPVLAVAGILALALGILMLRSTQWGLIATIGVICLLPFAALPLPIGFSPTFLDVTLIAVYLVWLFRLAERKQTEFVATPVFLPLLAFLLLAVLAFVAGLAHASLSANVLRHFAEVLMSVALFYVIVNTVRTWGQLTVLVRIIVLAGFAAALAGVVLYYLPQELTVRLLSALGRFKYPTGMDVIQYVEDDPSLPMRAISTSTNPNLLGGLLILVTSVTAMQLFAPKPVVPRWMLWVFLPIMGMCLYLTYSRGSMFGLAVGLVVVSTLKYRRLLLVMAVMAIVALMLPQTQNYIAHALEGLRGEDLATQMRFGEYKDALTLISRYPWLGVGFAGTPDIDLYIGVSNVYLMIAEQMGLLRLAAFLLTMIVAFANLWRGWRRRRNTELEPVLLGFAAALTGIMVGGMLDHYFFNLSFPHSIAFFWIFVGLAVVAARLPPADSCSVAAASDGQPV